MPLGKAASTAPCASSPEAWRGPQHAAGHAAQLLPESEGRAFEPHPEVPGTAAGHEQARKAGRPLRPTRRFQELPARASAGCAEKAVPSRSLPYSTSSCPASSSRQKWASAAAAGRVAPAPNIRPANEAAARSNSGRLYVLHTSDSEGSRRGGEGSGEGRKAGREPHRGCPGGAAGAPLAYASGLEEYLPLLRK